MATNINSLSDIERTTLFALYYVCNGSIHAHYPEGAIVSKGIPSHLKGDASKALKKLEKKGLCNKHPTGRNTTYSITVLGIKLVKELLEKSDP